MSARGKRGRVLEQRLAGQNVRLGVEEEKLPEDEVVREVVILTSDDVGTIEAVIPDLVVADTEESDEPDFGVVEANDDEENEEE